MGPAYLKARLSGAGAPTAGCVEVGKCENAILFHRNHPGLPALDGAPALCCGISFFVSQQLSFPFGVT